MFNKYIHIRGARTHNLKNISVKIPLGKLTVITGVSGSGKSSLAIDTLYAEGERRYVESLSSYAKQFLERLQKPDIDSIDNLPPAIALEHKNSIKTSRSTVATFTEIHDYLRLIFSRIGKINCTFCERIVKKDGPSDIANFILNIKDAEVVLITFPINIIPSIKQEEYWSNLIASGFIRVMVKNKVYEISTDPPKYIDGVEKMYVIVDRLNTDLFLPDNWPLIKHRLISSIETAYRFGKGKCFIIYNKNFFPFSNELHCAWCDIKYQDQRPALFSFNHSYGACPQCRGFGDIIELDETLIVPDKRKTIKEGAIEPWNSPIYSYFKKEIEESAKIYNIPLDIPYEQIESDKKKIIWEGTDNFTGIKPFFEWVESKKYKVQMRVFYSKYRKYTRCPQCNGRRHRKEALLTKIGEKDISEVCSMTIPKVLKFFENLKLTNEELKISQILIQEIKGRLNYLIETGLDYITLDRQSKTLSGGETQKITLASALGSSLSNTLYVLDEPTIGLHPRDTYKLLSCLNNLCKIENTVVIVEHDRDCINHSDWIIDLGPEAGELGGKIIYEGEPEGIKSANSLTGKYLSFRKSVYINTKKRTPPGWLVIRGACENNLKNIDVKIPLGLFTSVTGVSGSGKSTLIDTCIYRNIARLKGIQTKDPGEIKSIEGKERISGVRFVDQSPISKTPRSTPVTYLKAFDGIRKIFASTNASKRKGLTEAHFSFNSQQGRCPKCKGTGFEIIDMVFLADVFVSCDFCQTTRYKQQVRDIRFKDKTIADILQMSVSEAIDFFKPYKNITNPLGVLSDIGMSYIRLGQPANSLSAGESQRLKLAKELLFSHKSDILYLFDEPTTGLHFNDIQKLLIALNRLVDEGNTVVVIEHNIDVISSSDWVIDLGPEGADKGGYIVAEGTPEQIAHCKNSYTGRYIHCP
ncbi:excinuclease ABC subunit A [bacterium Unc6]|nr:excinuclease ABC subunit A [bacterium Unc6]